MIEQSAASRPRGFVSIGLDRIKDKANLGGALRAAECYGASLVVTSGGRMGRYSTDTRKAYKHIPCIEVADLLEACPFAAVPVVIELGGRAKSLVDFVHPPAAYYIFGPEDGSVLERYTDRVQIVRYVPTHGCMNLAATVNVVLYDRIAKQQRDRIGVLP